MANEDAVADALRRAYAAIDPSLERSGEDVVSRLRRITSRQYPPSAPAGSPPARRSGQLSNAFRSRARSKVLSIWNTAAHFEWVEEGTSKMKARPSLSLGVRTFLVSTVRGNLVKDIVRAERGSR